jgi:integrase
LASQVERCGATVTVREAGLAVVHLRRRSCVHPGTASRTFHHLVATLDLPLPDGTSPPRLHDLRHSFAIGRLLRWYREGADPSTRLHELSTFLGHVSPTSTAVYLMVTPQLLDQANRRFEAFTRPVWETVAP